MGVPPGVYLQLIEVWRTCLSRAFCNLFPKSACTLEKLATWKSTRYTTVIIMGCSRRNWRFCWGGFTEGSAWASWKPQGERRRNRAFARSPNKPASNMAEWVICNSTTDRQLPQGPDFKRRSFLSFQICRPKNPSISTKKNNFPGDPQDITFSSQTNLYNSTVKIKLVTSCDSTGRN